MVNPDLFMCPEKMKVAIFRVDAYDREKLEQMNSDELTDLVTEEAIREDKADLLSLQSFQELLNSEELDMNGWWLYFVYI